MEPRRKGRMLASVLTVKLKPWSAIKCSDKMCRLRTVGGATIDSKYSNPIFLLLCVS